MLYSIPVEVQNKGASEVVDFLLRDESIEEIVINGSQEAVMVYDREKGLTKTDFVLDEKAISSLIQSIAVYNKKKIDEAHPVMDARLPDGSRVNATIPPATPQGSTITIRKFLKKKNTLIDLVKNGTLTSEAAAFLWCCVEGLDELAANIIIAGGTGSGKTTTLNTLCSFIPPNQRIVVLEDTMELQIAHQNVVRMEAARKVTMDSLLKNCLRMRPDRIIVGEVRGSEAVSLFEAMNTGHRGVMGTLHANSAKDVLLRVTNPPMNVPQNLLSSLDLVVIQKKMPSGKRRVVEISEIATQGTQSAYNQLFLFKNGALTRTKIPSRFQTKQLQAIRVEFRFYQAILEQRKQIFDLCIEQGASGSQFLAILDAQRESWKSIQLPEEPKGFFGKIFHKK